MRKKMIGILIGLLVGVSMFSQFILFEQDVRIFNNQVIPLTQIQWDQEIGGGFSMGPYVGTTFGWNEALWMVNYTSGNLAFGLGTGAEQLDKWSFRIGPWAQYTIPISRKQSSIQILSCWEFGQGAGNYWYTNSITYETPTKSLGVLLRKDYGIGPIGGHKLKIGKWNLKLSGALPYDFEDSTLKPTIILTVTN